MEQPYRRKLRRAPSGAAGDFDHDITIAKLAQ
jgi:hypothetical protein